MTTTNIDNAAIIQNKLTGIVRQYRNLLHRIDGWFSAAIGRYPEHIRCAGGCSGCCRGLFDIPLLDAILLRQGFDLLPQARRIDIQEQGTARLAEMQRLWPDLAPPFMLNHRPEHDWEALMPDDDETPCPLLDDRGRCMVYEHRPMTCRLHGLPLVDVSGTVMHDEWCSENFTGLNPLALPELAAPFEEIFRHEVLLGRELTRQLLGETVFELDTLIPLAVLVDYQSFDWHTWWRGHRDRVLPAKD